MDDKLREIKRKHATPLGYGHMLSDEDIDYLIEQAKKLVDELEAILTLPQKEDAECTCRPNPYNKFHSEPPLLTDVNCPIHGKKDSPKGGSVEEITTEGDRVKINMPGPKETLHMKCHVQPKTPKCPECGLSKGVPHNHCQPDKDEPRCPDCGGVKNLLARGDCRSKFHQPDEVGSEPAVDWTSFEAGYLPTQHTFHNAILELKRWVGKNRRWIGWFENYEWKSGREELAGCIQALEKRVDANSDLRETIERLAYRNKHRIKALEDIVNLPGA